MHRDARGARAAAGGAGVTSHEAHRRHPPAARHREDHDSREDGRTHRVRGGRRRDQDRDQARGREAARRRRCESVRTTIAHGKIKRQGRFVGQRSDWKKAYVRLRDGEKMPGVPGRRVEAGSAVDVPGARCTSPNSAEGFRAMPIRTYKPTSPGRRFQTVQVFDEITTSEPYKPLTEPLHKSGGRNNHGELTSWWRGGGHKRLLPHHRLQARQARHPGEGRRRSSTTRTARRGSRCVHVRRRREALHPAAGRAEGRRHASWPATNVDILPGNALPLKNIPLGTHGAQRRAEAGQGRADRAQRRVVGAAGRQGRRVRVGEDAVGRDPQDQHRVPARRSARSATSITRTCRSARRAGAAGWASGRTCAASR